VIIICFLVSKFDEDKDKKDYLKRQNILYVFSKIHFQKRYLSESHKKIEIPTDIVCL